jgi:1-phosphofructokinase family hexose kinase
MITIITLNPLLEEKFFLNDFEIGKTARVFTSKFACGGKGINISRQLNKLGVENLSVFPLGGNNGKIYRHTIESEKMNFSVFSAKSETRKGIVIIDQNSNKLISSIITEDFSISSEENIKFREKIEKMMENSSIVVFAGSLPNAEAKEILLKGIAKAKDLDKVIVVDTYGSHLREVYELAPMIIHNNVEEVERSLSISLKTETEKLSFLKSLQQKGINIAILTDGNNAIYVNKFGFEYKIIPPQIEVADSTGSGDAFVAGILYGIEKSLVIKDSLVFATSLGVANASEIDVCSVDISKTEQFLQNIEFFELGTRMKTIDDSPNY